jgi:diamine N-acetyltransferase
MLHIRTATISDVATIQNIAYQTWPTAYGNIISQQQIDFMLEMMYSHESLTEQMNKGDIFFIAEFNNTPIGFASISIQDETTCKLNKLYVLPNIQKTGAGKALLVAVINFAKARNATQLQLQVNRNNNAKDFYIKHGFTILYQADFEIGNGFFMNDFVMGLDLVKATE